MSAPACIHNLSHIPPPLGNAEAFVPCLCPSDAASVSSASTAAPKPVTSPAPPVATSSARPTSALNYDSDSDGQAAGGRRKGQGQGQGQQLVVPLPTSTGLSAPAGRLLKGATTDDGKQKDASLLLGIKLDLEAEVHLTARVKGDVVVGLY